MAASSVTGTGNGSAEKSLPKILNGVVKSVNMARGAVTFFKSAEQIGTGDPEEIAHGLGVVPSLVMVIPTDTAPATAGAYTVVEGEHDATNVIVDVTLDKKFIVVAYA